MRVANKKNLIYVNWQLYVKRTTEQLMNAMCQPRIFLHTFAWLLACALLFQAAESACNSCQVNGAACINETAYHLCFGGNTPNTNQLFKCKDGLVCTDRPTICFQRSERPASCGDIDSCGLCNENLVFACTSKTTFAFCFGAMQPSDVKGTCPAGSVCDASTQNICVKTIQPNSVICSRD